MLKQKPATLLLAAAVMVAPMVLVPSANASPRYGNRYVQPGRELYPNRPISRPIQVRPKRQVYQRVVRLRNGDYRLPNGQVISYNRVTRFRNPGYWRLPNGDIIVPTQEIMPARTVVRLRDGSIRLPNGIIIKI